MRHLLLGPTRATLRGLLGHRQDGGTVGVTDAQLKAVVRAVVADQVHVYLLGAKHVVGLIGLDDVKISIDLGPHVVAAGRIVGHGPVAGIRGAGG